MNQLQLIQSKIYEIRGQKVMLDRDLAELYQVTTGNLNKAVKRNMKRFPSDFMFQLTMEEFEVLKNNLIFQNGISKAFFYICIVKASELQKERLRLARKLYQTRNELGIKQSDLQKEGIISQSHLSKIENAEINVSAVMLNILAKRYGKDISSFFE